MHAGQSALCGGRTAPHKGHLVNQVVRGCFDRIPQIERFDGMEGSVNLATRILPEASIEEKIRTRERIQNLKRLEEESQEAVDALHSLSARWKSLQTELADLRKGYLSDSDEKKL